MSISDSEFKLLSDRYISRRKKLDAAWALLEVTYKLKLVDRKSYRDIVNIIDSYYNSLERMWNEIKDEYYGNML